MGDRPHRSPQMDRPPRRGRSRSRSRSLSRDRDRLSRYNKDDRTSRRYFYSRSRSRSPSRSPVRKRRSRSRDRSRVRSDHYDRSDKNRGSKRSPSPRRRKSRSRSSGRKRRRSYSRSRSRSVSPDRRKQKRRRSRSVSSSGSNSSGEERNKDRRRKKKDKHRKRSRSRDRKERKKDKKKDKKKKKTGAVTSQYGKYGIIVESDLYNKGQEFRAWLVEERKINPETQSKESTRKEFAQFMEDYNTATLPHEKYYNMDAYERRMNALRHGELLPAGDELTYDVNADLKAHSSTHKRKVIERESYLSKEQLMELRKVQNERIEAGKMKLLGMDLPQNLGVRMDGTAFDG